MKPNEAPTLQLTTVWPDGYKSSVKGISAPAIVQKTLEQVRRSGSTPPVTTREDLIDLLVGPEGALYGGVHTYMGMARFSFVATKL